MDALDSLDDAKWLDAVLEDDSMTNFTPTADDAHQSFPTDPFGDSLNPHATNSHPTPNVNRSDSLFSRIPSFVSGYSRTPSLSSTVPRTASGSKVDELILKFRHVRQRRKLNMEKVAGMLEVSKSALSKFNSGRDPSWEGRRLLENWMALPENIEALRGYTGETKPRKKNTNQNAMPGSQALSSFNGDSMASIYRGNYPAPATPGHPTPSPAPQPAFPPQSYQKYQSSYQNQSTGSMTNYGSQIRPPSATGGFPGSAQGPSRSSNYPSTDLVPRPQPSGMSSSSSGNWQQQESIVVLAHMLKRETNQVLHKGIDCAINDFLLTSKSLKEKKRQKPEDGVQADYLYKNLTKLLLTRLTAVCGDAVVTRATNFLSQRKAAAIRAQNAAGASGKLQNYPPNQMPGYQVANPAPQYSGRQLEAQRMAHLLKTWNHACSCKLDQCSFPSCAKMKPAVKHQQYLKEKMVSCPNMASCEHCSLYKKLSAFSSNSRYYSRSAQSQTHTSSSYAHAQSTQRSLQQQKQGNYTQTNSTSNNVHNFNSANVNYNIHHYHAAPKVEKKPSVGSTGADDMSAVADLFDDRKHNLNISVNVNINRNQERSSSGYKRKGTPTPIGEASKKSRPDSGPGPVQQGTSVNVPMSSSSATPNSRSFYYNVDDDLADLFKDDAPDSKANVFARTEETARGSSGRTMCVICHSKDRDVVFSPCQHCCACQNCARKISHCPICRQVISSKALIYLS